MVAFAETSRPTHRAYAQTCVGSSSCARGKNPSLGVDRNQQYSVTALTNGSGTIVERYSYTAYGQPAFFDGSGTAISSSAENNRYTYTGREWDEDLHLYHYRARMYDAVGGRFCSRDPIGYEGSQWGLYRYVLNSPVIYTDPTGLLSPPVIVVGTGPQLAVVGSAVGSHYLGQNYVKPYLTDKFVNWFGPDTGPLPRPAEPPNDDDDDDCDAPDDCDSRYPEGYDSCDDFSYSSAQAAAEASWGRGVTLRGKRDAYSCTNGIGTHQNAFAGGQFQGSVLCCDCCDDSSLGEPSDGFGCKAQ